MLQMMTRTAIHPLKIAAGVGAAFVLWGLVLAYASSPAYADTTFAVNSTGDENDLDFPGGTFDGSSDAKCDVDSGAAGDQCTLRAAIQEANVTSGADTINFGLGQSATITLASQLPTITDPAELTIDGGSTDITVSGGGNVRVFQVASGAKLALDNLTVANGLAAGDENPSDTFGGGAANFGGTLTISNSTFSGNDASGTSFGGGVATTDGGTLNVTDSTFSGNSAVFGGGIYSTNSSTTVTNSTFSGNIAFFSGGGIDASGAVTLKNTIVANSTDDGTFPQSNCGGTITDGGYNIDTDGSCVDDTVTTSKTIDPLLDPNGLQDNGGPTQTMALQDGSPAIDAIPDGTNGCGTDIIQDQRGVQRPKDGDTDGTVACDIGAFELVVGDCQPSGSDVECTFDSPGISTWTVPEGVTQATFKVSGAQGGREALTNRQGGDGGMVRATIDVKSGDTLQVNVGGAGADGAIGAQNAIVAGGAGGFNGGAAGGSANGTGGGRGQSGGGGGGASDIRFDPDHPGDFALDDRIIVAGGGGGTGAANGGNGGAGGPNASGINGDNGGNSDAQGGSGGSASSGGAGGAHGTNFVFAICTDGVNGTLGVGGVGGECRGSLGSGGGKGGGGGGGGYYGGGGGGGGDQGGGGGGGSGFVYAQASDVEFPSGGNKGNGLVTITYTPPDSTAPTVSSIKRAGSNPTNTTGNVDWTVTFSENVTSVDTGDFALVNSGLGGSPTISSVTQGANASVYTVTASTGTGSGTFGLNLNDDDSIADGAGNKLGGTGTGTAGGGETGNGSFTGELYTIDRAAPTVTSAAVKGPNFTDTYTADTWANKDVRVTFTCADTGGSGLTSVSGNDVQNFTTDTTSGTTATFSKTCKDNAGNAAAAATFGPIKIDKSAPTLTASAVKLDSSGNPAGAYNAGDWSNKDVRVTFACADVGPSGLTSGSGNNVQNFTTETDANGATATSGGTCTDNAGNAAAAATFGPIKIDKTAPSVSCSVTPSKLRTSANNHKLVTVTASVSVTDSGSGTDPISTNRFTLVSVTSDQAQRGLASDDVPNDIQGWTTGTADTSGQLRAERYGGARTYTLTYRGYDLAGNTAECKPTVTVPKGG